jgi:hypothetical protein
MSLLGYKKNPSDEDLGRFIWAHITGFEGFGQLGNTCKQNIPMMFKLI